MSRRGRLTIRAAEWFDTMLRECERDPAFMAEGMVLEITAALGEAVHEQGITGKALAERLGTSPSFVSQVLHGKPNMTLFTLARFALALGLQPQITFGPWKSLSKRKSVPEPRREVAASVPVGERPE